MKASVIIHAYGTERETKTSFVIECDNLDELFNHTTHVCDELLNTNLYSEGLCGSIICKFYTYENFFIDINYEKKHRTITYNLRIDSQLVGISNSQVKRKISRKNRKQ